MNIEKDTFYIGHRVGLDTHNTIKFYGTDHAKTFILRTWKKEGETIYLLKMQGTNKYAGTFVAPNYYSVKYLVVKIIDDKCVDAYSGNFGRGYKSGVKELVDVYVPIISK